MREKILYALVFSTLLLMCAPNASISYISSVERTQQSALASDVLYIDSDFTFTEDISTPIEVIADHVVIDGAGYKLQGPGSEMEMRGIKVFGRSKVTIKNLVVDGWERGIWVNGGEKIKIKDNIVRQCGIGIDITLNEKAQMIGNTVSDNSLSGFYTYGCLKALYLQNIVTSNGWAGFIIANSFKAQFIDNTVIGQGLGIGNGFYICDESAENYFTENDVYNTGRCYWLTTSTHNNTLVKNTATNAHNGFHLLWSDFNILTENEAYDSGFYLQDSSYNYLEQNHLESTGYGNYGMYVVNGEGNNFLRNYVSNYHRAYYIRTSDYNTFSENEAVHTQASGFLVHSSHYNTLEDNIVMADDPTDPGNHIGYLLWAEWWVSDHWEIIPCTDNILIGNEASGFNIGVNIRAADGNTLLENTIFGNRGGVYITSGSGNLIYHNNIIDNNNQAMDTNPEDNYWFHPDLHEGNYWSDYTGLDDGSFGRVAGDGIGDTDIPWYFDLYPFMMMNGWL